MLRQNRSEGSSTSRSFAKTALLRARRKTFQFSDEQCARYIFFTEPLFLIPFCSDRVQESRPARANLFGGTSFPHAPGGSDWHPRKLGGKARQSRYTFFRRNHFSSCRPAEPVRLEAAREIGFARGPPHSFRGNHFSSFLPAEIGCPGTPADRLAENHCTFFEGTTFPPSFRPRLAQQEARTLG